MSTRHCNHTHANGTFCKSPPLRHREYCHFHLDQIGRQLRAARARARHQPARLKLPLLEDPFAVQVALMQVADAITHNELDLQRGRLLMSVLRLASRNLKTTRDWKQEPLFAADANAETAITEWPTFEQENELPQDFDLSADPDSAFPPPESTGAPYIPGFGMYGNDNPTAASSKSSDDALRARIRQALGEAKEPTPSVTAESVELMDIYEREGQLAARKFADRMVRNDRRRERRLQRAHYEEVARNHTIKLAAKRLLEDQQREAAAKAQPLSDARPATDDANTVSASAERGQRVRKKPPTSSAAQPVRAGAGKA